METGALECLRAVCANPFHPQSATRFSLHFPGKSFGFFPSTCFDVVQKSF
eukprot:TRINITY_DN4144_c0_g1_i1.p2 TRINITY_DN4144_c0_g1~~TRINITY_DN4144_c0_g1_i1.p2  ORF type:complete len:50 (-),score=0.05 TRINITY_DN4144_c0_g1_i1:271-420(-)